MDDDLDNYKLDTAFYPEAGCVVHTSWNQDSGRGLPRVKVEQKWYRRQGIGAGAFGSVHLEVAENDEHRAVKKISKALFKEVGFDYRKELTALSLFSKSKFRQYRIFVTFLGWFENSDTVFLATEYLPKGDLSKYLNGEIKENDAKVIARQLLEGLQILHAEGFTHRDIEPQARIPTALAGLHPHYLNIFVVQTTPAWWVKIGDFGISKCIKPDALTELRTQLRSPGYDAPEIRDGESSTYTNAVDIWSFGCVAYQLMALNVPFLSRVARQNFCAGLVPFPEGPLTNTMSADGIEFLRSVLIPNPTLRPTAGTVLKATWISSVEIVVGLDLGIEHCVVSWMPLRDSKDLKVITDWPKTHNKNAVNVTVPSRISYANGKVESWGYPAISENENMNAFTILQSSPSDDHTKREVERYEKLLNVLHKTSQDIVTDYIENLWPYILKDISQSLGRNSVPSAVRAVIAVPDGLSVSVSDTIRKAAVAAGLPKNNTKIIPHSEVTVLFLVLNSVGRTFTVLEATRRRLRLISYKVENIDPWVIGQAVVSTGAERGSNLIDLGFEDHIKALVGQDKYDDLCFPSRKNMMLEFTSLKENFTGMGRNFLAVDLVGVDDDPERGIEKNTIQLRRKVMREIFDNFLLDAKALLAKQVSEFKEAYRNIEIIVIIGDFEPYNYLCECVAQWHRADGIRVMKLDHRSLEVNRATAISRAATLGGLGVREKWSLD